MYATGQNLNIAWNTHFIMQYWIKLPKVFKSCCGFITDMVIYNFKCLNQQWIVCLCLLCLTSLIKNLSRKWRKTILNIMETCWLGIGKVEAWKTMTKLKIGWQMFLGNVLICICPTDGRRALECMSLGGTRWVEMCLMTATIHITKFT